MNSPRLYAALYADTDVRKAVVSQIKAHGYDIVAATALKHYDWSDEKHLMWAAAEERAMLIHNIKDYNRLYNAWWVAGRTHAGIIECPQEWPTGEIVRRLLTLLNSLTAEELVNNYVHLGRFDPAP